MEVRQNGERGIGRQKDGDVWSREREGIGEMKRGE